MKTVKKIKGILGFCIILALILAALTWVFSIMGWEVLLVFGSILVVGVIVWVAAVWMIDSID